MLKRIILLVIMLVFAQQEFYAMKNNVTNNNISPANKVGIWKSINNWVNRDYSGDKEEFYPKLWWLWAFVDNVPLQYGGSKIWKHGEAYYGLSNGIGCFPSFLNYGWLKIGIGDAHINVINLVLDYFKSFIQHRKGKEEKGKFNMVSFFFNPIAGCLCFNIHIISFKIMNCIKIKLIAPLTILLLINLVGKKGEQSGTQWYITYNTNNQISWWYALLSPRIEINISEIINYFFNKK